MYRVSHIAANNQCDNQTDRDKPLNTINSNLSLRSAKDTAWILQEAPREPYSPMQNSTRMLGRILAEQEFACPELREVPEP